MTTRRGLVGAAVAVLAGGAGLGVAWWQRRALVPGDVEQLWAMRFERPEGGELLLAPLRGKPLLVNFWATWCAPCLRELPAIDRFHRQYQSRGWQVVGLAVDSAAAVREFLTRVKVGFPIGLAGPGGIDLIARLGDTEGGLPFTVVIDSTGQLAERKLGETRFDDLVAWADKIR